MAMANNPAANENPSAGDAAHNAPATSDADR